MATESIREWLDNKLVAVLGLKTEPINEVVSKSKNLLNTATVVKKPVIIDGQKNNTN
jgi:hypothetical protein